ncbi:MAG: hypothetical protein R3257_02745 [bacterium]|nr:hypothetical protein [bacterium]
MKKFLTFSLFLAFLLSSTTLQAKTISLIFLYPGGQGSQEQAQPLLDNFAKFLKENSQGKIDVQIKYFSNEKAGEQFIQSKKPAAGILAEDLFVEKGNVWQAQKLLQTLQLPSGDGTNQYFIIGNNKELLPTSGSLFLMSTRPLTGSFVRQKLFPDQELTLEVKKVPNVVGKLRKIGRGQEKGFVLLDQFEYATIKRLKASWANDLKTFASSKKVPSAPFVVFKENISSPQSKELKKALLKLTQDGKAKETLGLLRIKGFQE